MPDKHKLGKRWLYLAVGLLVSAFFLWLAIRPLLGDPEAIPKIIKAFKTADYRSLPVILLTLFVFYWLKAWRWRLMLVPVGNYRPLRDLFGPVMIGFALNNALPARLGEVARCLIFSRQQRVPFVVSLSSVVLERVFDGLAVVFYLMLGLTFITGLPDSIQRQAYLFSALAGVIVLSGLAYVIWTQPFVRFAEGVLHKLRILPRGLIEKFCRILEAGAQGLAALKDIRLLIAMLVISLVKWALNGFLFWIALWSFDIEVSAAIAMILMAVVAFAVALPQAPGYFGTIQFCFMTVLQPFDLPPETVFAASIYYHMSQWIPVTITGFAFLLLSGFSIRQVEQEEEKLEESQSLSSLSP